MAQHPNPFVWYELMTSDTGSAVSFYRSVIGWGTQDSGMASYTLLTMGTSMVGGVMAIPDEARARGARPVWLGYIGVDDVDAYAKRVSAAGGAVHKPPEDIPGVGRFAVVADPHGAMFMLFKGSSTEAPAAAPPGTPGHVGWHELRAGDGPAAFKFYSDLFGWTAAEAVDMGPMGVYQTFAAGGAPIGGIMTKTPETPMPSWLYYFNVESVDAAIARVKDGGGRITNGPMEVPGGSWIAQGEDPQGAAFAVVAPTR